MSRIVTIYSVHIFSSERLVLSLPAERFLIMADRISSAIPRLGELGAHRQLASIRREGQRRLKESDFSTTKGKMMCRKIDRMIQMLDML